MNTDEQIKQLREVLREVMTQTRQNHLLARTRERVDEILKATAPKHPVEVEFESAFDGEVEGVWQHEDVRRVALHFARWGMNHAATLVDPAWPENHLTNGPCSCAYCTTRQHILDAAAKVPSE